MSLKLICSVMLCALFFTTAAQDDDPIIKYELDSRVYLANAEKQLPFWARSMQRGKVQPNSVFLFDLGVYKDYKPFKPHQKQMKSNRRLDYAIGIEAAANLEREKVHIILPQAYAKIRYGQVELAAGRFYETMSFMDSTMTMGSYIWSGNAMPLPKIALRTEGFVPLKFTKGLISMAGFYAHGWFENDRGVENIKLHQKALYGRLGKPYWKVKLYGGFNHQVQWGGKSPNPEFGNLPTRFRDYLQTVFGSLQDRSDTTTYSTFDAYNRLGNHLGSLDVGMDYDFGSFILRGFRQNFYDDGSLFYLSNIKDGLQGLVFSNKNKDARIMAATLEFMYSKSQGGRIAPRDAQTNAEFGRDDYFNHSQYTSGWTYHGHVIGTPFFSLREDLPNPDEIPSNSFIANNRVSVWHLGVSGNVNDRISFLTKISYSSNSGTYNYGFEPYRHQLSTMIEATLKLPNIIRGSEAKLSIYTDKGELWEDHTAISFSFITRNFEVREKH